MKRTLWVLLVALAWCLAAPLHASGGSDDESFYGTIQSLPASGFVGDWAVGGKTIHVTAATVIDQERGAAAVGAYVEVKGTTRGDGSIDASKIEVKTGAPGGGGGTGSVQFNGVIESRPAGSTGDWVIGGRTVHVASSTVVDEEHGPAKPGALVEVHGTGRSDGSVDATRIEVQSGTGGGVGGESSFLGFVEARPAGAVGDWLVGGTTVHVSSTTVLKQELGAAVVGAAVEVKGTRRSDGSLDALVIEVKSPASGGAGSAHFYGVLQALPASGLLGDWTVGGKTIHVAASTSLNQEDGTFTVGAFVEVEGTARGDGSIDAARVELRAGGGVGPGALTQLEGPVEALPATAGFLGDWRVGGKTVRVSSATRVGQNDGPVALSAFVHAKGLLQADGSVNASEVEVVWSPRTKDAATTWLLPSSARAAGLGGTFFTTNLTLTNASGTDANVTLKFLGHELDGRNGPERRIALAAGKTATYPDVLGTLFGLGADYGAIRITSDTPGLVIQSETSTPGGGGTYGQGLGAVAWPAMLRSGEVHSISGVREDSRFRTNLVLANGGEAAVEVDVLLVSAAGVTLAHDTFLLPPLGMRQLSQVARRLGVSQDLAEARLVVRTATAGGAFTAYVSVIDQTTGDPRVIQPQ